VSESPPAPSASPVGFDLATPFRQRAGRALNDTFLQQALTIATTKFIGLRGEAFGEFPEGEALRDRAREIKEATLQRLDHYLGLLVDNVEARGGHVHFASTAAEARAIVLDIGGRTGARLAVKSKSMATEEIELNEALLHAGITPVETDLGEYIIQMAGEKPSHIIAPAIHKTKGRWPTCLRASSSARWPPIPRSSPASRAPSCARSSCARTSGSPGPTSAWPRREPSCS